MININKKVNVTKQLFSIIVVGLLLLIILGFSSSGVAFASDTWQDKAIVGPDFDEEKQCFKISTAEQLAYASRYSICVCVQTGEAEDYCEGYCSRYNSRKFILTNNIDLHDHEWIPWGTTAEGYSENNRFSGEFDGNGYVIKNMRINATGDDSSPYAAGLFSWVNGGVYKNIILNNIDIMLSGKKADFTGGIIGEVNQGYAQIINCEVTGKINVDNVTYNYKNEYSVGGVLGRNKAGTSVLISGCRSNVDITSNYQESNNGVGFYVGGIAGHIEGFDSKIIRCMNMSNLTSKGSKAHTEYAGGIAGMSRGKIQECYNYGNIVAGNSDYHAYCYAGGIVGKCENAISNCGNVGNVSAYAKTDLLHELGDQKIGQSIDVYKKTYGFFGCYSDTITFERRQDVLNLYKTYAYAGGICGDGKRLNNCFNSAQIEGGSTFLYLNIPESVIFKTNSWWGGANEKYESRTIPNILKIYVSFTGHISGKIESNKDLLNCYYDKLSMINIKEYEGYKYSQNKTVASVSDKWSWNPYGFGAEMIRYCTVVDNVIQLRTTVNGKSTNTINYNWKPLIDGEKMENYNSLKLGDNWEVNPVINDGRPYVCGLYW